MGGRNLLPFDIVEKQVIKLCFSKSAQDYLAQTLLWRYCHVTFNWPVHRLQYRCKTQSKVVVDTAAAHTECEQVSWCLMTVFKENSSVLFA